MHSLHHLQTKTGAGDPLAAPVFLIDRFLHALPLRAAGHVGHFDALCLELVADAVGLGPVLGLLGSGALLSGDVVALVNYMSQILVELVKLANLVVLLTRAIASMGRVSQVLDTPSTMTFPEKPVSADAASCLLYTSPSPRD